MYLGKFKVTFRQYYMLSEKKQNVMVIVNLPITHEKYHCTTSWTAELIRLMQGTLFPSKSWWLWKGDLCCVALVAVKRAGCDVWQLECQAGNVTASVQSDHLLHGYTLPVFFTTDQSHRPPRCDKISPCLNKPLPQLIHIADWCLLYTLLHHVTDAVINQV